MMKNIKYFLLFNFYIFYSCTNENHSDNKVENKINEISKQDTCPCDSIGLFKEQGKNLVECYIGKSQIGIAYFPGNDTMDVRRYYTTDSVWHLQEVIEVKNSRRNDPEYDRFCDIKDTLDFYKLTFISNEDMYTHQGLVTNSVLGVEVAFGKDTIKSKSLSVLIPKEKFKGIVKIEKVADITYKGKRRISRPFIFIEAENMIKYGNLLDQYKVIVKNCEW